MVKKLTVESDFIVEPGFTQSPAEFLGLELYLLINEDEKDICQANKLIESPNSILSTTCIAKKD